MHIVGGTVIQQPQRQGPFRDHHPIELDEFNALAGSAGFATRISYRAERYRTDISNRGHALGMHGSRYSLSP